MKSKTLNSLNSLKGFSETFSIYELVKKSGKTIQTIQNPSERPKNRGLQSEKLKSNHSGPFSECRKCENKESIEGIGDGCNQAIKGYYKYQWSLLDTLEQCPRGLWN
jgi:hypothetical protein